MRVNLAKERKQGLALNKNYLIMFIIFIVLVAGMYIQYTIMNNRADNYEEQIEIVNEELEVLREKRDEYLTLKDEISEMEDEIARLEEDQDQKIPSLTKQNWNITLLELGKIIPDKVMINSLSINDKKLSIKGYGEDSRIISEFLDNLLASKLIVNIRLHQLQNGEDVSYDITADINSDDVNLEDFDLENVSSGEGEN
ncbi:MAG: PilN domain-containing protein [Bacillota bacterium]